MTQKLGRPHLHDNLSFKVGARAVAKILVRRPTETISAAVDAAAIAIDRVVECHVGAVIVADDRTRFRLFKYFDLGGGRLANPFDRMHQPGIWRIFDVAHACNLVLSVKQMIAKVRGFCESNRFRAATGSDRPGYAVVPTAVGFIRALQAVGTTAYPETGRCGLFLTLLLRSNCHEARLATSIDQQERRLASAFVNGGAQVGGRANRLPVHFLNHVAALNTGGCRRSGRID